MSSRSNMAPGKTFGAVLVALTAYFSDGSAAAAPFGDPIFTPPAQFRNDTNGFRSPLLFDDGHAATTAAEWTARREEILRDWHKIMGPWPELLPHPKVEFIARTNRE